ncbi:hypothetical protein M231_07186 [Tremella mesenterica]|uniref:Cytoplasmic protein n=1 Tax=Tremella mesenterica TaxID=5217 RepID=A0A4Q1BCU8_TREME|nr:hypothetical protein M231_07186 [Tremella mesenterica]
MSRFPAFHTSPVSEHPYLALDEDSPPDPRSPPSIPAHIQEVFCISSQPRSRSSVPPSIRARPTTSDPGTQHQTSATNNRHRTSLSRRFSQISQISINQTRFTPSPEPIGRIQQIDEMSRPAHPSHIPLPSSPFRGRSPNGSPPGHSVITTATPASPTSPRTSFLPHFMRTRSRAATINHSIRGRPSPGVELGNPLSPVQSMHGSSGVDTTQMGSRQGSNGVDGVTRSSSTPVQGGLAGGAASATLTNLPPPNLLPGSDQNEVDANAGPSTSTDHSQSKTYRIRLVPHLETSRSLAFDPVVRELLPIVVPPGVTPSAASAGIDLTGPLVNGRPPACLLKIGRFTDKTMSGPLGNSRGPAPALAIAGGGGDVGSGRVAFKSKVVSRSHAEIWCEPGGKFFIRDTSSSSGTFLNHIRLSSPSTESRPTQINDGDILQLGVDYQGGHEDQFRCVKMRVELGREWQRAATEFNTNALKQLKALGGQPETPSSKGKAPDLSPQSTRKGKASVTDCCICLFSVTVCQSLFIAPCSHVFHYKCIRPLLMQHHPGFCCPLCRTFANLEEDVEAEDAWENASRRASVISRRLSNHSARLSAPQDPVPPIPTAVSPHENHVNHQMTGSTSTSSEEGNHTANGDTGLALARQSTAVAPAPSSPRSDVDMISVPEDQALDVLRLNADPALRGSLEAVRDPSVLVDALPIVDNREEFGSLSQAATPMNDTFLSTLAPGMHQRLDLAQQLVNGNGGVAQQFLDGNMPVGGVGQQVNENAAREVEVEGRGREDMDMMFT